MTEAELLVDIGRKLDKLIALAAIQGKEEEKQLSILNAMKFTDKEVSIFMGIPVGALKMRRHRKRNKKI
jgi:hypothetical protein